MVQVNEARGQMRLAYSRLDLPCPKCGRYNAPVGEHVTDFHLVREGARLAAGLPREQLTGLLADLRAVERGEQTPNQLAAAAPNDTIRRFWDLFPRTRNELYAFVTVLATVLTLLLAVIKDDGASPEQLEQIIQQVVDEGREQAQQAPAPAYTAPPTPPAETPAPTQPEAPDRATPPG
jgi:hypothetical protein